MEHILNVLARLRDPQRPAPVATHLTLKVAPLADTTRYDLLRTAAATGGEPHDEENGHAN